MSDKNYTSIFSIKDMALNQIMPKYFDINQVNTLNTGFLGYVTEIISSLAEDSFNTISTYIGERFPNTAIFPETIYNYLTIYQYTDILAKPANISILLFISEKEILSRATDDNGVLKFILDQNTVIDIEGQHFILDYDVEFLMKKYKEDYIYTITYYTGSKQNITNDLNPLTNPYIKNKIVMVENEKYVALDLNIHQTYKEIQYFNLISNDKINLPTLTINHIKQLANFEVFYKAPKDTEFTQLKKFLTGTYTATSNDKFCYYEITDSGEFTITFSRDPKLFTPEFNSEIEVHIYTTDGSHGNFTYTGNQVLVLTNNQNYPNNEGLQMYAFTRSESMGGRDILSFEQMRQLVMEKMTTIDSYSTETDLQLYFDSLKVNEETNILFIKKRDDVFERYFSSFLLLKRQDGDFYQTNTCYLNLKPGLISDPDPETRGDFNAIGGSFSILRPGRIFEYASTDSKDTLYVTDKRVSDENISDLSNNDFRFVSPFLIVVWNEPDAIGFYMNSVDSKNQLTFDYVNDDSIYQFIATEISVYRNAIRSEQSYQLEVSVFPSTELEVNIVDPNTGIANRTLVIKGVLENNGEQLGYIDFEFDREEGGKYYYKSSLQTTDVINDSFIPFINSVKDISGENISTIQFHNAPMSNAIIRILTFYYYPGRQGTHKYGDLYDIVNPGTPEEETIYLRDYVLTNEYTNEDAPIDFIIPYNNIRSYITNKIDGSGKHYMTASSVPVAGLRMTDTDANIFNFIHAINNQYQSIFNILDKITNNYSIDIKFYNTYGKSRMFRVGEEQTSLDRVNCNIFFKIKPNINIDTEVLVRDLKIFIKEFIEDINNAGYNSLYVSNLIQAIENTFEKVRYLKFESINNYGSDMQVIDNMSASFSSLSSTEKREYVPEYLTIVEKDIRLDII